MYGSYIVLISLIYRSYIVDIPFMMLIFSMLGYLLCFIAAKLLILRLICNYRAAKGCYGKQ